MMGLCASLSISATAFASAPHASRDSLEADKKPTSRENRLFFGERTSSIHRMTPACAGVGRVVRLAALWPSSRALRDRPLRKWGLPRDCLQK
jgi:hypothetical protein